ncbi:hypothetical protein N7471_013118 [Penicillium samsonianum]|uniref:uncharacterized protein n=1 Tax=Penicillium samsonianum TaxID=1882272 RepID=UPI0025485393|nr:uncharacterized protein N7471_013118 [Penicillium samsonianum]KAJ6118498.1 hypothetical protein N7471_013118 [Penicillium samsonianum]
MPRHRLQPQLPLRTLIGGIQIMLTHPLYCDWWTPRQRLGSGESATSSQNSQPKKAKRGN